MYRSLVPMQHLCWQLASNVRFSNQRMFNVIKNVLIRSLAYMKMVVNFVHSTMKTPIKSQSRVKGEGAHYCHECDVNKKFLQKKLVKKFLGGSVQYLVC